jgi:hypothetical protein
MGFTEVPLKSANHKKIRSIILEWSSKMEWHRIHPMILILRYLDLLSKDVFDGENIHFDLCDNTLKQRHHTYRRI